MARKTTISEAGQARLERETNLWLTTVRPNGRPHMVPIWFVALDGRLFIVTEPGSVKVRNLQNNPHLTAALENGNTPVICEGTGRLISEPWPEPVIQAYQAKYDWNIPQDNQYRCLIEITPQSWLEW